MDDTQPQGGALELPGLRLWALLLLSAGLLLLEISLTKIFSIVLWYHFGFLVISIALMGFAMSGVWLSGRPQLFAGGGGFLARLSAAAALCSTAALWLVAHTQVDAYTLIRDHDEGSLIFVVAILLVPFFFLGASISATLTLHRERAGTVYAYNLVGSGLGCALAIFVFDLLHWSAPLAVLLASLAMAVAAVLFALTGARRSLVSSGLTLVGVGGFALLVVAHPDWVHLRAPASKPLHHVETWDRDHRPHEIDLVDGGTLLYSSFELDPPEHVIVQTPEGERRLSLDQFVRQEDGSYEQRPSSLIGFTEWTSLSRVDAFDWPRNLPPWGWWGLSSRFEGAKPSQKGITIDSWAMTNVIEWGGGETGEAGEPPEMLEYLPASLCHRLVPQADVLCIGAGGGMDLLAAKRFGARRITGVEINPGVVRAVLDTYLDFQGRLYDPAAHPEVAVHVAEGRHWLETDDHVYDIVQLSGVDTYSTTQAGAFSLSENFLYTAEAFDTYLSHVTDGGLVTLTRWVVPDSDGYPRNTLKLFVLAWEALERAGVADPTEHLYLVESQGFSVILFGKTAFSAEQLATLETTSREMDFQPLYRPGVKSLWRHPSTQEPIDNQWELFAMSPDKQAFLRAYPYDVAAPVDNRPFFFETSRFRHLWHKDSFFNPLGGVTAHAILVLLLGISAIAGLFFVVLPLVRDLRGEGTGTRRALPTLLYFGALGLGFILVEVVLSQKFILYLGNPLYALSVVLFSVLIFSGLGSALSSRVGDPRKALLVVIALAAVYPPLTDFVFDLTLQAPTAVRIAVAVLLLAPLATAMGMPFPLGVSRIADEGTGLVAWAWGINGYTSVVGSVLTVILSFSVGFDAVVWIGAAVYGVALLASPMLLPSRA